MSAVNYQPGDKRLDLILGQVTPNDLNWGLIVGDIAHNLRSALDHLIYQLALLNGQPTSCSKKTAFPICIDEQSFARGRWKAELYIHPAAFAFVEELQPYKAANLAGKRAESSYLWTVSELDIIDKHRMLITAEESFRLTGVSYGVNDVLRTNVPIDIDWRAHIVGTPVTNIDYSSFKLKDEDKMHANAQMEVQVFFHDTGTGCDGLQLQAALRPCIRYVSDIVELFNAQFFNSIP